MQVVRACQGRATFVPDNEWWLQTPQAREAAGQVVMGAEKHLPEATDLAMGSGHEGLSSQLGRNVPVAPPRYLGVATSTANRGLGNADPSPLARRLLAAIEKK